MESAAITTRHRLDEATRSPRPVRTHPVLLRFDDPDLELEFRALHDRAAIPTVRLAAALAIVLYAGFGILDAQVAEDELEGLLLMRGTVVAYIGVCLALTYHPAFPRIQQVAVCSTVLVAGLGMALMQVIATVPDAMAAMGTMLTLMFLFSFVRARFVPASITAVLLIAGYEAALLISERTAVTVTYLNFELVGFLVVGLAASQTLERLWRQNFLRGLEIQRERERSEALLHNVLPVSIANRLRLNPSPIAEVADDVTVLFADIVGFTPLTERTDPTVLVAALDQLFARFDALAEAEGVEKIKTIGDGYMAVAGVPEPHSDGPAAIVRLALGIREAAAMPSDDSIGPLSVRVGVCTGPALAGVIGRNKFAYDLWGDTVNTASRLESHSQDGAIQICAATRQRLGPNFELAGPFIATLKGKGPVRTWQVLGARVEHRPRDRATSGLARVGQ